MLLHVWHIWLDPSGLVVSTTGFERTNVTNNISTFENPIDTSYRGGYLISGVDQNPFNQTNLSWASEVQPLVPAADPKKAFNRLFTLWDSKSKDKTQSIMEENEKSVAGTWDPGQNIDSD